MCYKKNLVFYFLHHSRVLYYAILYVGILELFLLAVHQMAQNVH